MKKIKKTSDAKDGGLFVGKSHDDGGIPAIVVDTGQPIEVEGGEAIINKKATAKHWKELSKINQSTGGVPIPPPDRADELMDKFEKGGKLTQLEKKTIHNKWKNLVNMTYTELRKYYDSKDGKTSGLTQKEADDLGIDSGRESAVWIMKMKRTNYKDWTPEMWRWAKKQISFISRMRGNQGELMENGRRTPKLKSLLIWGHNPYKYAGGGDIPAEAKYPVDANSLQVMLKYASKEDAPAIQEQIAKLKQEHKEKYQKNRKKYKGGGKPSDIASAILGLKALLKYPELLEKFDKENIEYTIKGLEILDKMHPSEIDPNDTSSGVKFIPYKDYEIMYDPYTKNYYANDAEFDSLEDAKAFLDSGKISDSIRGAMHYEVYGYSKGGSVNNQTLLAPNGKPTKLTPEQYKLVRTPEFKAWFGDWENDPESASKVVDSNGEPKIYYQGVPYYLYPNGKFIYEKDNNGIFFTSDKRIALTYGVVKEVFINCRNPKDIRNYFGFDGKKIPNSVRNDRNYDFKSEEEIQYANSDKEVIKFYKEVINKYGKPIEITVDSTGEKFKFKSVEEIKKFLIPTSEKGFSFLNFTRRSLFWNWIAEYIKNSEYDGIFATDEDRLSEEISDSVVVYNSNQIKLADGTNTTFDSENPDIRFEDGGSVNNQPLLAPNGKPSNLSPEQYKLVRTLEFKAWFGDWEKLIQVKMNDSAIDEISLKKISDTVSKVVDSNGEPMVVYHTTDKEFFIFDKKKSKEGFFFSPQKERLSVYNKSKIGQYFLNVKNPSHELFKSDVNYILSKGYDGIMDYGHARKINESLYEIIVFEPNQIKLADGTNTTFDSENPDIRFEDGGKTDLTYKEKYNKKYGYDLDKSHSLEEIASKTGISLEGLQEIFNKGVGAYRTNPESVRPNVKSPEQWGMARVYSAVMGGKTAKIDSKELKMEGGGKTDSEMNIERYVVKPRVKFGMVFGYVVYDNLEKKNLPYDYDEDEQWKAQSKADLQNELEKNRLNKMEEGGVTDKKDTVTLDIPLLIRLLELSREDIQSDADLHKVVENMLDLKNKEVLTMEDYDKISQIAKEKLISQAHYNLTRKQGRPEYAPNSREIEAEIERMINTEKSKFADGGILESDTMVVLQSPTEMLDEINFNAQFKPE